MKENETFIEKLMRARTVKITSKNPGSTQGKSSVMPVNVIRQGRDIALDIVAMDNNVPVATIIKNPAKYSKDVEKAFHAFLDGYGESVIPEANPGRHRAQAAVDVFESLVSGDKGFFAKHFPGDSKERREQRALILKSACLQIVDGMLNAAKIETATKSSAGRELDEDVIGMNFAEGLKGKDVSAKIAFNRYYQLTLMTWVLSLVSKLYELDVNDIKPLLIKKLGDKSFGELNEKSTSIQFTEDLRNSALRQLGGVFLPNSLK